jgi:hypothetical protein
MFDAMPKVWKILRVEDYLCISIINDIKQKIVKEVFGTYVLKEDSIHNKRISEKMSQRDLSLYSIKRGNRSA